MVKKRTDYSDRAMQATRSVLLEVIHLLKEFENSIILVGGWVPIMLLPDAREKHVGTIDVDLALDPRQLSESSSSTIESILLDNGYTQGDEQGRYYRTIDIEGKEIDVPVDFLTGEHGHMPRIEFHEITGIEAITAPGCDLTFDLFTKVRIEGRLPDGMEYATEIKSASIVAFVVMKAHALELRDKSKDAYDIWFCLANYPMDRRVLASEFKPHLENHSVKVALNLLAKHFDSVDADGPESVAKEEGTLDPEYRTFIKQDAYQRVKDLLGRLNQGSESDL